MKGVYFLQISDGHTEKFSEVEEIILTREQYKQLDNPQLHVCLPSDYHFTASSWGRDAVWCVFFLCNLFQQPLVCPLCLAEECRRSGCRQDTTGIAVSSDRNDIMCFNGQSLHSLGNLGGCRQIICSTDTRPFMVVHLTAGQYTVGIRNTAFVCLWCTFTLKMHWQIVIFTVNPKSVTLRSRYL